MKAISLLFVVAALGGCGASALPNDTAGDDTAAVQAAVDRGGVVSFEARTYHLSKTIVVRHSNTVIQGVGPETLFVFKATSARVHCHNDRAFTTPCELDDASPRRIGQPIAIGDRSFTAAEDASDLQPGDWLLVSDFDSVYGDRAAIDWMQVASVEGTVINTTQPFRMAFTTKRKWTPGKSWMPGKSGLGFKRIVPVVENTEFRNFAIAVGDSGDPNLPTAGISVFLSLHTIIDHVQVDALNGQALYSYLAKDLTIRNCTGNAHNSLNEFGATVDLALQGNTFTSENNAAVGLDLGTGFFDVSDNTISMSRNSGAYLLYSVHDGTFSGNHIAFVDRSPTHLVVVGILAWGVRNVAISNNTLDGGAGPHSVGISVRPTMGEIPEPVVNVTVSGNTLAGFALDYEAGTNHN